MNRKECVAAGLNPAKRAHSHTAPGCPREGERPREPSCPKTSIGTSIARALVEPAVFLDQGSSGASPSRGGIGGQCQNTPRRSPIESKPLSLSRRLPRRYSETTSRFSSHEHNGCAAFRHGRGRRLLQ